MDINTEDLFLECVDIFVYFVYFVIGHTKYRKEVRHNVPSPILCKLVSGIWDRIPGSAGTFLHLF